VAKKSKSVAQLRYCEIIAKVLHDKGDCGSDYGTWEEMTQSGAECDCYTKAGWIVAALGDSGRVAKELSRGSRATRR
jgi:hypothetical protein